MKTKIILAVACCLGLLLACVRHEKIGFGCDSSYGPGQIMQSYIHSFHDAETLKVIGKTGSFRIDEPRKIIYHPGRTISPEELVAVSDAPSLMIEISPESYYQWDIFDAVAFWLSPNDENLAITAQYHDLVDRIGDTSFGDREIRWKIEPLAHSLLNKITSVTITCDKAFDAQHPVGSSLNDLFTIAFNDPIALIENDYQTPAGYYQYPANECRGDYPYAVLIKKLSTVDFAEHPYLDYYWNCRLDKAPAATDTYTFTVRVDFADRSPLEASATMTIEGEA